MFHHFHGAGHPVVQGSVGGVEFRAMLEYLYSNHNVINADVFRKKYLAGDVDKRDICLTFDDGLACQYDVALPILNEFGVKAFFFVYTSIFEGGLEMLEIHRYFRTVCFDSTDDFYSKFFDEFRAAFPKEASAAQDKFRKGDFFNEFSFYSDNDRYYRYVRNYVLGPESFNDIYLAMMDELNFDCGAIAKKLWMSRAQLKELTDDGHYLGLHSHSHPTDMRLLGRDEQRLQYSTNKDLIEKICGFPVKVMSHPCGSYNDETLEVLRELGIEIGFRSNEAMVPSRSTLELPRIDHMTVYRELFG